MTMATELGRSNPPSPVAPRPPIGDGDGVGVGVVPPRRRSRPSGLVVASVLVALVLCGPLIFLLVEAQGEGVGRVWDLIDRGFTVHLLLNTAKLTLSVTLLCAVIGTGAAWLVERTALPGRHIWAVLLVVPLAIPDFVISFGWASLDTHIVGFRGAVLVMTLSVYPLVYLPVASSFRNADPAQEEVARSLGVGRLRTFWSITIGQARTAVLGGCLLVTMVVLAEYGALDIMSYNTLTVEIFSQLNSSFSVASASALSLVLVVVGLVVLGGESLVRGRARVSRSDRMAQRPVTRHRLGWATVPVLLALTAIVGGALGVPVGSAIHWWAESTGSGLPGVSILSAPWHTASYSAAAAAVSTLAAVPVGILAIRHDGRLRRLLERSTYLVLAMPGVVIALSISYFSERYANDFLYQSAPMLVLAYAILFFPLALVGVRTSVAQAPVGLEDVAFSLGQSRLAVLWRVTRPLVGPGLAAAFCLVFLSAVTELTATLLLVPTGVQTLATQFWSYQSDLAWGQAAPFALMMIALAAVPSYFLGRFFDRLPAGGGRTGPVAGGVT
jgi:iron(III) transport system permease protein